MPVAGLVMNRAAGGLTAPLLANQRTATISDLSGLPDPTGEPASPFEMRNYFIRASLLAGQDPYIAVRQYGRATVLPSPPKGVSSLDLGYPGRSGSRIVGVASFLPRGPALAVAGCQFRGQLAEAPNQRGHVGRQHGQARQPAERRFVHVERAIDLDL